MEEAASTKPPGRRTIALTVSAVLCLAVAACYWLQPDWLVAATLVPAWCWLLPAFVLVRLGFNRKQWRLSAATLVLWLAFTTVFVPEARSLLRFGGSATAEWNAAHDRGRVLRVVSLNCRIGNAKAAAEVAQYDPDIVLLQESPNQDALEEVARELFGADGEAIWDFDTSILARGRIDPRTVHRSPHFIHAAVKLSSGLDVDVVSVRLNPPVFRLDFWMPGFWREHRNNRVKHRRQIQEVMNTLDERAARSRLIVGGDFNAPAGDGALSPLRSQLSDTFQAAGRGWGNTGTNRFPLFRVDQIWASRDFRAESTIAHRTVHSDHRLVVCDLAVGE